MTVDQRLELLIETLKLAFSKPGFQPILEGLELDAIDNFSEMIDKADLEGRALLKLAGEDLKLGEPQGTIEKLYKAIDENSDESIDISDLTLQETLFFLRFVGNNFPECKSIFGSLFDRLSFLQNSDISNLSSLQEKHRIFAEFYPTFFKKNGKFLERFEKSIKNPEEIVPALSLYGSEILQFDDTYPLSGVESLSHILRNKNDFFTKKSPKAVEGVTKMLSEACKTTYGIDALAKIREKLVIYTLSGRKEKMLK